MNRNIARPPFRNTCIKFRDLAILLRKDNGSSADLHQSHVLLTAADGYFGFQELVEALEEEKTKRDGKRFTKNSKSTMTPMLVPEQNHPSIIQTKGARWS